MRSVFAAIARYIEHGPAAQQPGGGGRRSFHATMTYFWVHMVHYALVATQDTVPGVRGWGSCQLQRVLSSEA